MTSQGNGEPAEYQVIVSEQIGVLIKQAHREAAQRGQGKLFVVALRAIQRRLQKDPHVFGEPLFHLPALKLLVYHAVVPPLVIHYALHKERPLVIVRRVELLG